MALTQGKPPQGAGRESVRGRVKRNMPDPIPVMAAEIAGIRALLVRGISEAEKRFYERYGFVASPIDPMTVMITLDVEVCMAEKLTLPLLHSHGSETRSSHRRIRIR